MDKALIQAVRARAGNKCEYCRMPMAYYPTVVFPVDHVIARQHGGLTVLSNLALSCLQCNSFKGPNIAGIDPITKKLIRLFNPRRHKWKKHFSWDGPRLVGRTAAGRVTVKLLNMNDPEAIEVRKALMEIGWSPDIESD